MSEKISSPLQSLDEEETSNCHPIDSRRVSCRNSLREFTFQTKMQEVTMKQLLDGEPWEEYDSVMNDKEESTINLALDPSTIIFRTAMDDDNYSKVRKVLHDSSEGPLRLYTISENIINAVVGDIDDDWEIIN